MANKAQANATRSFVFGHTNAESIIAHLHDIQTLVARFKPLAMGVSESFLKPDKGDELAAILHYKLLRNDRRNKAKGGVAMYVHEAARCRIVGASTQTGIYRHRPEFLVAEIILGKVKILCILVYNPPKSGFWTDVEEAILNYNVAFDQLVLMGDLNIDLAQALYKPHYTCSVPANSRAYPNTLEADVSLERWFVNLRLHLLQQHDSTVERNANRATRSLGARRYICLDSVRCSRSPASLDHTTFV